MLFSDISKFFLPGRLSSAISPAIHSPDARLLTSRFRVSRPSWVHYISLDWFMGRSSPETMVFTMKYSTVTLTIQMDSQCPNWIVPRNILTCCRRICFYFFHNQYVQVHLPYVFIYIYIHSY